MENVLREFTRSVALNLTTKYLTPTPSLYDQDQPLDLSVKKTKISVASDQLENIKIKAEACLPCPENLAIQTINPMVEVPIPPHALPHPVFNNSWQKIKSILLTPDQLENHQQAFDALGVSYPSYHEFFDVAARKAAEMINVTDVTISDQENITPKTVKTKRKRSSTKKSAKRSKRAKLNNNSPATAASSAPAAADDEEVEPIIPVLVDDDGVSELVVLGANGTSISRKDWNSINWKVTTAAITRKLLLSVFDKHTLANNTLSGKPSPAFIDCNKPEKGKLNPKVIEDIIAFMVKHFGLKPRVVKATITSKCADESKSLRHRLSLGKEN